MRASTFFVLRTATITSCERFPTSCTGEVGSESPCTGSPHILKLFGDLVASVSARLAARAGSSVLSSGLTGGSVVSISVVSATLRGLRIDGAQAGAVSLTAAPAVALEDGMGTVDVRGVSPLALSRLQGN